MTEGDIQIINVLENMDPKMLLVVFNAIVGAALFASVTHVIVYKNDIL